MVEKKSKEDVTLNLKSMSMLIEFFMILESCMLFQVNLVQVQVLVDGLWTHCVVHQESISGLLGGVH